jgi:7-cyano-7-deazaguanine synthase
MACRLSVLAALSGLTSKADWKTRLGTDHVLDLGVIGEIADSALTRDIPIADLPGDLPNTFVPGRNLMFLVVAAALAWRLDCRHLIAGVGETDFSGYPDCRDDTIKALQVAVNLGMGTRCVIHTPLMRLDKSMTWKLAEQEGGPELVSLIRTHTHSCYLGERETPHDWGYGCGACPACLLRARGWATYAGSKDASAL